MEGPEVNGIPPRDAAQQTTDRLVDDLNTYVELRNGLAAMDPGRIVDMRRSFAAHVRAALTGDYESKLHELKHRKLHPPVPEDMETLDPPPELRIVFNKPMGSAEGGFVRCEDSAGRSVNAGTMRERADGYWELVLHELPVVRGDVDSLLCYYCGDEGKPKVCRVEWGYAVRCGTCHAAGPMKGTEHQATLAWDTMGVTRKAIEEE